MRAPFFIRLATLSIVALTLSRAAAFGQPQGGNPQRDQRPASQSGTAVIRGRVFAGDTGRPMRRARIIVSAPELGGNSRNTSTDADGRYEVNDLPAGRYTLRVTRSGYLTLRYGQRRPLEQGKPLQLFDKQIVEHVDFSLPRMGVITGRVSDEFGDPIEGVNVYALRSMYFDGRRQLVPTGSGPQVRTDDGGQYRLLGLAPGTYFVTATTRETWTINREGVRQVMGYAPTYFPGTTRVSDARRVSVPLGQEASNTDFSLVPGRAAKLSGTAFDSHGRPFSNVSVRQEVRGDDFASFGTIASTSVAADGTFTLLNVPPGEYMLAASSGRESSEPDVAIVPIAVDGTDVDNVALTGSAGGSVQVIVTNRVTSVTGQLADDKGSPLPDGTVIVFASDSGRWAEDSRFVRSVRPDQQGQWQMKGLPAGEYLAVAVESVEDGQWNEPEYLESIRRYGQKLTLTDAASQSIALKLVAPSQP